MTNTNACDEGGRREAMSEKMIVGRCVPMPGFADNWPLPDWPEAEPTFQMTPYRSPEPPSPPITQERVAAAFEAWIRSGFSTGEEMPCVMEENGVLASGPEVAQRLAAGLFKYLERV